MNEPTSMPAPLTGTHVVLGGGAAGGAIARELRTRGAEVRVVAPREPRALPARAQWVAADANDAGSIEAATRGADVVYMAAQPGFFNWATEFPPMLDAVIRGVARGGAPLVFVDNLYTYGPIQGPLSEDSPEQPASGKGRVRLAMARALLDAHQSGLLPVVIGRASSFFGPGVHGSTVGREFFQAILDGQAPHWFGRADQPHALTFIDDFARALVLLGQHDHAFGRVWHIPTAEPLTATAFVELVAREAGVPVQAPSVLPEEGMRALGSEVPILREYLEVVYQMTGPWVVDGSRFAAAFEFEPTPNAEAVRKTLEWIRSTRPSVAATGR